MSKELVSQVVPNVNENNILFIESNGQMLFSAEEVGRQLGYKDPDTSINRLFKRNQDELSVYTSQVSLTYKDGSRRQVRHFTEEGVYIISMLAKTPEAKLVRARLATFLRTHRDERLELAHQAGYMQGYDEARALPEIEEREFQAYERGLRNGARCQRSRDGLVRMEKALHYRRMGLSVKEVAKLLRCSANVVYKLYQKAKTLQVEA